MLPAELAAIAGVLVAVAGMLDEPAELTAITSMLAKLAVLMGMLAKPAKNYEDVGRSNSDECHCPAAITSAPRYNLFDQYALI